MSSQPNSLSDKTNREASNAAPRAQPRSVTTGMGNNPPKQARVSRPSAKVLQAAAQEAELMDARVVKQAAREDRNRKQRRNQIVDDDSNDLFNSDKEDSDDENITDFPTHQVLTKVSKNARPMVAALTVTPISNITTRRQQRVPSSEIAKTASTGRPKAGNYDDFTQGMIYFAIEHYRLSISSEHAFPSASKETDFLRKAWRAACVEYDSNTGMTPTMAKLITQRGSHLRGELKTKARPLVEASYGFEAGEHRKIIKKNRETAEFLKEHSRFLSLEDCKGLYQTPLIQKIVNVMWFQNKHDEGVKFIKTFNPFPIPALALVLSVIDCCIDEWITGIRTDTPFKAKFYADTYEGHLKNLREFQEMSRKSRSGLSESIFEKLHNRGRFNAGAQPASTLDIPSVSHRAIELAIQEYLNDSATDTDGENGPPGREHDV
ncbi:hypothetical protein H0H92_001752 [Tricholoma furcatifolium]|nr:hypothetical protein H0H92_001752 [Tricholoma furcatifolium]